MLLAAGCARPGARSLCTMREAASLGIASRTAREAHKTSNLGKEAGIYPVALKKLPAVSGCSLANYLPGSGGEWKTVVYGLGAQYVPAVRLLTELCKRSSFVLGLCFHWSHPSPWLRVYSHISQPDLAFELTRLAELWQADFSNEGEKRMKYYSKEVEPIRIWVFCLFACFSSLAQIQEGEKLYVLHSDPAFSSCACQIFGYSPKHSLCWAQSAADTFSTIVSTAPQEQRNLSFSGCRNLALPGGSWVCCSVTWRKSKENAYCLQTFPLGFC